MSLAALVFAAKMSSAFCLSALTFRVYFLVTSNYPDSIQVLHSLKKGNLEGSYFTAGLGWVYAPTMVFVISSTTFASNKSLVIPISLSNFVI